MSASVLGESWVVASAHTEGEDARGKSCSGAPEQTRSVIEAGCKHGSESTTSSVPGPELIMPSIYETPITETSWVVPNVRAKAEHATLRRRHQSSAELARAEKAAPNTPNQNAQSATACAGQSQSRLALFETAIRAIINIILCAAISHLLIFPELVQQYQTMCSIGAISALYPSSCISPNMPHFSSHKNSHSTTEAVLSSQARLELLFNATLREMAPLDSSLKQTESQLRTVEQELRLAQPGTKHELDLEFESCWRVIRIAAWKFDSLKVDLQSAVDSLVSAGDVKSNSAPTESQASFAHDARLSTQMLRREAYVNQLMARMRSKADSLAADLATLDDHLESIENIVDRETERSYFSSQSKDSSSRLSAFVDAIVPPGVALPSFLRARRVGRPDDSDVDSASTTTSPKLTLSEIFGEATRHHRSVARLARNLSKQLQ
ncbi:hypothetical protein BDW72DRAFT_68793 [Aspergillus terricola var. indicus]